MRLQIEIKTNMMPILYRHRILAFIKESLSKVDNSYKKDLYDVNIAKPFSFYLQIPTKTRKATIQIDKNFVVEDDVVDLKKTINLYISSSDDHFIITFLKGITQIKTFNFSVNTSMTIDNQKIVLEIEKVMVIPEKLITNNIATFRTNSPIFVRLENGEGAVFKDNNFEEMLNIVVNRKMKALLNRELRFPLKFKPLDMHKVVVKHTLKDFRENTNKPIMYLNCNYGTFKLQGHPQDLQFLYQSGIGSMTGQGFGMIDVV